jgi:plasmid maintenance system antidote protein VapI
MKFGDFLLKIIFWSGMTQAEVARKCNMSTPVLNDIVKNRRSINVRYAKSFEDLFGIPTMILLMWSNIDELNDEK